MSDSNFDAAMAVAAAAMDAPDAPSSAPSTTTEVPASPTPDAPTTPASAPSPSVPPETLQKLRERNKSKREQAEREAERRELLELKARINQPQAQSPAKGVIDADLFKRDPVKAIEDAGGDVTDVLNRLSKHVVTPDTASLEARMEARFHDLMSKHEQALKRIDDYEQREQSMRQHESHTRAQREFIEHTADKAKFPTLASLDGDVRAAYGKAEAQRLINEEGMSDFSLEEVAELVEQRLQRELSGLLGRDPQPQSGEPTPSQPATSGRNAQAKRPNTITSDAASSTAAQPRAMTEKERVAAAIAVANRK